MRMQPAAPHIIQRQVFLLDAISRTLRVEWDIRANDVLKKVMMPVVESCFDALQLDDRHLIIDKLEIDLGVFLPGNFEEEAGQRLSDLLSAKLNPCRSNGMA